MRTPVFSLSAVLLLLCVLGLAACGDDASEQRVRQLRVEDMRYVQRPDGDRVVRGTLANSAAQTVRNVQIEVSLLDRDNRRIETALISVNEVPAKGHTPFRQVLTAEGAVQGVRIRRIRAL